MLTDAGTIELQRTGTDAGKFSLDDGEPKKSGCCSRLRCGGSSERDEPPEESLPLKEKLGKLTIDLVNPKFKSFDRPLRLALIVATLTFVLFLVLVYVMQSDCTTSTFTGTPGQLADLHEKGTVACINSLSKQGVTKKALDGSTMGDPRITFRPCFFAPPISLNLTAILGYGANGAWNNTVKWYTDEGWSRALEYTGGDYGFGTGYEGSGFRGYMVPNHDRRPELQALRSKDLFCEGSENRARYFGEGAEFGGSGEGEEWTVSWEDRLTHPTGLFHDWHPYKAWEDQCELVTLEWGFEYDGMSYYGSNSYGAVYPQMPVGGFPVILIRNDKPSIEETTLVAEYRTCPKMVTTLGSAFGWATFIELGVTVLVVTILLKANCLVNNSWGYRRIVKEMLTEALSDKPRKDDLCSPKRCPTMSPSVARKNTAGHSVAIL